MSIIIILGLFDNNFCADVLNTNYYSIILNSNQIFLLNSSHRAEDVFIETNNKIPKRLKIRFVR